MEKRKEIGTILYLTAFVLWMTNALVKYTYFKDILPMDRMNRPFYYMALVLLLVKLILDFRFHPKHIAGLALLILYMIIAWAGGRLQFSVMFALIYCAHNISFKKILQTTLVLQLMLFLVTVIASQTGILEDVIWEEATRQRHGLGFTHCMLASHFGLYIALIYIGLTQKMTIWRAMVILAWNAVIFYFTDGRTDMYLSILFVVLAFAFGNIGQRLKGEKILGILAACVPFVLCVLSVWAMSEYDKTIAVWQKLNTALNGRLMLGNMAIEEYGLPIFGHRVKWVGVSVLHDDPTAFYNYVDNSYLMMIITYGVVFIAGYCAAMAVLLYRLFLKKETMMITCLMVILAFGVINPQSMYLTYNPFLVLLAGVWNPPDKRETL